MEKREHVPTGRILSLKIVPFPTDVTQEQQAQILRELTTFASCEHPNIVTFFGSFLCQGAMHLGLEYMDRGSLLDAIKAQTKLPEEVLAPLTKQVLDGLHYLHVEKHLIHRDVKPSNLLLDKSGVVKITDFGVTGELEEPYGKKITWVGTIYYMSPERVRGDPYLFDSDLWSLGLTIAEAVTGIYQYGDDSGNSLSFWELMRRICEQAPPRLAVGSDELKSFLDGCLQKEPEKRLSAKELLDTAWIASYVDQDLSAWALTLSPCYAPSLDPYDTDMHSSNTAISSIELDLRSREEHKDHPPQQSVFSKSIQSGSNPFARPPS